MQNQKPTLKLSDCQPENLTDKENRFIVDFHSFDNGIGADSIISRSWSLSQKPLQYYQLIRYQQIIKNEQEITKDLMEISVQSDTIMVGLNQRIKTLDSFMRKVNTDSGGSQDVQLIKKVIDSTNDIIRYTYQDEPCRLVKSCQNIQNLLKAKQYRLIKVKNTWLDCNSVYKGINCVYCTPKGQKFEIQFHTPESYELKNGELHQLYEKARQQSGEQECQMNARMLWLSSRLETPLSISKIRPESTIQNFYFVYDYDRKRKQANRLYRLLEGRFERYHKEKSIWKSSPEQTCIFVGEDWEYEEITSDEADMVKQILLL